jgi:hypothetical protein
VRQFQTQLEHGKRCDAAIPHYSSKSHRPRYRIRPQTSTFRPCYLPFTVRELKANSH